MLTVLVRCRCLIDIICWYISMISVYPYIDKDKCYFEWLFCIGDILICPCINMSLWTLHETNQNNQHIQWTTIAHLVHILDSIGLPSWWFSVQDYISEMHTKFDCSLLEILRSVNSRVIYAHLTYIHILVYGHIV